MTLNRVGWLIPQRKGLLTIQGDLERLENWVTANKMNFNRAKCKVLLLGSRNEMHKYRMEDTWLNGSTCERGLGVLVNNKLNIIIIIVQFL